MGYARVLIASAMVEQVFKKGYRFDFPEPKSGGSFGTIACTEGLPRDAVLVDVMFDAVLGNVELVFQSDEWDTPLDSLAIVSPVFRFLEE